jgi:predicted nucleic acid-binding protein
MKILLDTNIILDIVLKRKIFIQNAIDIYRLGEQGAVNLCITSNSVTDIVYIATNNKEMPIKRDKLDLILLKLFEVIDIINVDKKDIFKAFELDYKDYEDALQVQCAKKIKVNYIVTRNIKDFNEDKLQVVTPEEFLRKYKDVCVNINNKQN